jgi:hypothetical protein
MFSVIRVLDWQAPDGWAWLEGYEFDAAGNAREKRSIFVLLSGLAEPVDGLSRSTD